MLRTWDVCSSTHSTSSCSFREGFVGCMTACPWSLRPALDKSRHEWSYITPRKCHSVPLPHEYSSLVAFLAVTCWDGGGQFELFIFKGSLRKGTPASFFFFFFFFLSSLNINTFCWFFRRNHSYRTMRLCQYVAICISASRNIRWIFFFFLLRSYGGMDFQTVCFVEW